MATKNKPNIEHFKMLLNQFVSFKSISTDPAYQTDIQNTVNWLENLFEQNGFKTEIWKGPKSNPVVYANYQTNPAAETVLVYGHYDVQPASKDDGWFGEPFSLTEKNGRLYARGVVDNKGQILSHIYTVISLINDSNLKYNVIFLVEGNEETSNDDLGNLVAKNKNKLKVDHIIVSDGEIVGQSPCVEYALRGGFNIKVKYTTAANNLHSGLYGGAVPNSITELTQFVSNLYDSEGKVTIPGFYDNVDPITPEQIKNNKKISSDASIKAMTGVKKLTTEKGLDFYSQVGLRPTIQPTGFLGGYVGEGFSNIVSSWAEVRINFRTVKSQNTTEILEKFKKHVLKVTPKHIEVEMTASSPYDPVKINTDSPMLKQVVKLLEDAYGTKCLQKPVGGGIPVVNDFQDHLGRDVLLVSLGNDDCNMHGVNENFNIDLLEKGLKFSQAFFSNN